MKILLTGAAGFIGFHTQKALVLQHHDVVGLDNINDYYDVNLKYDRLQEAGIDARSVSYGEMIDSTTCSNCRFVRMDLTDKKMLDELFQKEQFDVVCNLAAQAGVRYSIEHPEKYMSSNVDGFFNLIEASKQYKIKHFVYASSSSVYGMNEKVPYSETDQVDSPVSLYAATKKFDELISYVYSNLYGLLTTGLRFFTVYGPWGRPDMAPMKFMKSIMENTPILLYNYGRMYRDFTYVEDVVTGILKILLSPFSNKKPYQIYNIGHSTPVSLLDFVATIEKVIGKKATIKYVGMQPGDVFQTYADTSKLQKDFHFAPSVSLKDGIQSLYDWYVSRV